MSTSTHTGTHTGTHTNTPTVDANLERAIATGIDDTVDPRFPPGAGFDVEAFRDPRDKPYIPELDITGGFPLFWFRCNAAGCNYDRAHDGLCLTHLWLAEHTSDYMGGPHIDRVADCPFCDDPSGGEPSRHR